MDFSLFDKEGGKEGTGAAKLRNQSLYQKFDPLVAAAQDAAPSSAAVSGYTEAEKDELVAQAVAQAEEEASIVQMETEEFRKELEAEREQNSQLTAVMEEYSAEITRLMAAKAVVTAGDTEKLAAVQLEKDQVQEDLEKTETVRSKKQNKKGRRDACSRDGNETAFCTCCVCRLFVTWILSLWDTESYTIGPSSGDWLALADC